MTEFVKYQHVERLGSDEVDGILVGTCYVFPKIDGTNASVWSEDGELCAGSRNRKLTLEKDNAGFYAWVLDNTARFDALRDELSDLRLFGEWLVPHTLRTYREEAWRNFYVFDVYYEREGCYLPHNEYVELLGDFGVDVPIIPPLEIVENPTEEHLLKLLHRNTYLIADGNGEGEGLVVKNYDYRNQYGRQTWAKIVRNEFKERNLDAFGTPTVEMRSFEQKLAEEYVTRGRVTKIMDKMRDSGPLVSKRIPELLGRVWHDVVNEETWDIVNNHKNPTIDFRSYHRHVIAETKRNCPELFG